MSSAHSPSSFRVFRLLRLPFLSASEDGGRNADDRDKELQDFESEGAPENVDGDGGSSQSDSQSRQETTEGQAPGSKSDEPPCCEPTAEAAPGSESSSLDSTDAGVAPPTKKCGGPLCRAWRWIKREGVVGWLLRLCLLVLLLIPAHDFLRVVLSRVTYSYEVEWLEGLVAMMGIRYGETSSLAHLYPPYGNADFVPVLYAPLYPMVLSWVFKLFGTHLEWGRLVSLLSVLGILAGVVAITWNHTRRWWPGIVAALSFLMFFKPCGYWYDVVRVDSFCYCLALWSAFLITTRRGSGRAFAVGLFLAYLTLFAKQTALFIPVAAMGFRVSILGLSWGTRWIRKLGRVVNRAHWFVPRPRWTLVLLPVFAASVALSMWYLKKNAPDFFFYLYEIPKRHILFWDRLRSRSFQELWQYYSFGTWIIPLAIWVPLAARRWPRPRWQMALWAIPLGVAVAVAIMVWIARGRDIPHPGDRFWGPEKPGLLSLPALRYVMTAWTLPMVISFAASCGGFAVWVVRWTWCKTRLPGVFWVLLLFPAQHIMMLPWIKIGGYVNNFMVLFVVQSAALGIALGWMDRAIRLRWIRWCITLLLCGTVWVSWNGSIELFIRQPRLREELHRIQEEARAKSEEKEIPTSLYYHQYHAAVKEYVTQVYDQNDVAILEKWNPWVSDGLRYHRPETPLQPFDNPYGRQIPPKEWKEDWAVLMKRLKTLQEDGGVYLPHQNYLGHLVGIPYGPNIDAVRDVCLLGKGSPKPLLDQLQEGHWRYVILMMPVQQDWVPHDFRAVIQRHFKQKELLVPRPKNANSFSPRTGALVRPTWVYEYIESTRPRTPPPAAEPEPAPPSP